MSQSVTIVGPNLRDQSKGTFHVHAEGCRDLTRLARSEPEVRNGWTIRADSIRDIVEAVYDPDCFQYDPASEEEYAPYVQDFHFAPCVIVPDESEIIGERNA